MDKQAVEAQLCQLPISQYAWIDPQTIEFSDRILTQNNQKNNA